MTEHPGETPAPGSLEEEVSALVATLRRRVSDAAGAGSPSGAGEAHGEPAGDGPAGRETGAGQGSTPLGGLLGADTLDSLADLADAAAHGLRRAADVLRERSEQRTPSAPTEGAQEP